MPYAQQHYPFSTSDEKFQRAFPADFVAEGIDQTRGWFYTLIVLGTHLFDTAPWKNLIVSGLVLGSDGKKMSKSLRNYPDPEEILHQYGSDALRLYLVNSPVVRGDNLIFQDHGVRDVRNTVIGRWINSLRFFIGQAELYERTHGKKFVYNPNATKSENVMDRWILARCQSLIKHVKQEMEGAYPKSRIAAWYRTDFTSSTLSLPTVHGRTATVGPDRRTDELVHPIQPKPTQG